MDRHQNATASASRLSCCLNLETSALVGLSSSTCCVCATASACCKSRIIRIRENRAGGVTDRKVWQQAILLAQGNHPNQWLRAQVMERISGMNDAARRSLAARRRPRFCHYPIRLRVEECRLILQYSVDVRNSRDEERGIVISPIDAAAARRQGGTRDRDISTASRIAAGLGMRCRQSTEN
jgi:hypothetical protein